MEINVLIDEGLTEPPDEGWFHSVAERVIMEEGVIAEVELGLVITSQEKVHQLNRDYRGKDEPTDVLSFTMTSEGEDTDFVTPPDGVLHLGEVIISYPQAVLQAKENQHSVKKELAILVIHGLLHLLGYDHEEPEDECQMKGKETQILSGLAAMF